MKGPLSSINRILLYLAWWSIWTFLHFYINLTYLPDWKFAISEALILNLILAVICYTLLLSLSIYRPNGEGWVYLILWIFILNWLWLWGSDWLLSWIIPPKHFDGLPPKAYPIYFTFGLLMQSVFVMMAWIWNYLKEKQQQEERKNTLEKLANEAELNNLRQQLQPHFLFNSLNSINALIGFKPDEARNMIRKLSDFLRGTIKKDLNNLIVLQEEINHLELYLDIEKVRFGHRLTTVLNIPTEANTLKLPNLILQPAIENAIKFGLYDTLDEVTITLTASIENKLLKIAISNPFDPSSAKGVKGTGFGLESIRRRLFLQYKRNDLLKTEQNKNEFITTLYIPQYV